MRILILTLLTAVCLTAAAYAQEPPEGDYTLEVVSLTADGYTISHSIFDYYPEEILTDKFKVGWGWNWFGCCEPLDMVLDGPLSNDDYDPLKHDSGDPGTYSAAAAAFQNNMVFLRYGFTRYRCPDPAHPSGEFYSTKLPGGGLVILRLPEGIIPAAMYADWRGKRYPLASLPVDDAVHLMLDGEPHPEEPEGSLETQVARIDCLTLAAEDDDNENLRTPLLADAARVIENCIDKYHERHGEYPDQLSDLTAIPGAVIARLPFNPYAPGQPLGLEDPPSGIGIRYYPDPGKDQAAWAERESGYLLLIFGIGDFESMEHFAQAE